MLFNFSTPSAPSAPYAHSTLLSVQSQHLALYTHSAPLSPQRAWHHYDTLLCTSSHIMPVLRPAGVLNAMIRAGALGRVHAEAYLQHFYRVQARCLPTYRYLPIRPPPPVRRPARLLDCIQHNAKATPPFRFLHRSLFTP